jgi:hypothetical protein
LNLLVGEKTKKFPIRISEITFFSMRKRVVSCPFVFAEADSFSMQPTTDQHIGGTGRRMSVLDQRYERLSPDLELLSAEAVLPQAWKKTDAYPEQNSKRP